MRRAERRPGSVIELEQVRAEKSEAPPEVHCELPLETRLTSGVLFRLLLLRLLLSLRRGVRELRALWRAAGGRSGELARRVLARLKALMLLRRARESVALDGNTIFFSGRRVLAGRVKSGLLAVALLAVPVLGYLVYCAATLPVNGGLSIEPTPSALIVEAGDGQVVASRGVFKGEKLAPGSIPAELAGAIIAIEDRRFYQHLGIDLRGMLRAGWRNLVEGKVEGGSTITQQLARITFLSPERTLKRKVQEAMLALWLEHQLSKQEILARYLNTAYFGAGAYGADAAAKRYFGKPAGQLSLSEAAMLAGLVRAPSALAPDRNPEGARERAGLVLEAMVETGAISREQAEAARRQPTELRVPPDTPPYMNYFIDTAAADVKSLLGPAPGDLRLRTTLNRQLQQIAQNVVAKRLDSEGKSKKVSQAALVALTYDGAILAMVGGRDYASSQFNRVTQARRQPGSLFKLFVYLAALKKGFTPQMVMVDRPVRIGNWEPENYGGRYHGTMTLRSAFANSINSIAVQLAGAVGIDSVIDVARQLGVQSELPKVPSVALGSGEVTLLEMTRAFAAIAANVEKLDAYAVRSISRSGQSLFTRPATAGQQPSDPAARAAILDLLAGVVREGTGKAARLSVPTAGKTGTSQDYRDAWFVGFTSDLVVGVWVGNDDNSPTKGVTGGSLPTNIWRDFVTQAETARKPPLQTAPLRHGPSTMGMASPQPDSAPLPRVDAVRGAAKVIDTGTLEVQGRVIRLSGVEGVEGRPARALARLLRRREVQCEPVGSGESYRCQAGGNDLAMIIVFFGGARASSDAIPELRAAEEQARERGRGIWRGR